MSRSIRTRPTPTCSTSWRANDWLPGRLDGCEQLVPMLLAPERLRQLGLRRDGALRKLEQVAVGPSTAPQHASLAARRERELSQLTEELKVLEGPQPLPRTFPLVAARITDRLRMEMLPEELRSLATAVCKEPDPATDAVTWADGVHTDLQRHPGGRGLTADDLDTMLDGSTSVGLQRIVAEGERGSDTFARTLTQATATLTATGASIGKPKAAVALLKAMRGYALLLWVLVNFLAGKSHLGRNLTSLILGVGGALVALAVIVPGSPWAYR